MHDQKIMRLLWLYADLTCHSIRLILGWKSIEELIDSMPEEVRKRINFLGEQRDIQKLLADSDALILASHYEGLPNVVCEALACGRPILASNVSDNRVLVKDGYRGFLFDPNKPDSISESISSLMKLKLWILNLFQELEELVSSLRLLFQAIKPMKFGQK